MSDSILPIRAPVTCTQSRQDYIIALKEKRRDTDSEEDSPGGAARHAEICGLM